MKYSEFTLLALFFNIPTSLTAPPPHTPNNHLRTSYNPLKPKPKIPYSNITVIEQGNAPWSLQRISSVAQVTQNGRLTSELSYKYRYDTRDAARGVDIYILDSGLEIVHPDFQQRAKLLFTHRRDDLWSAIGHGTHVAGIAASLHYGVAKSAAIYGIKISLPVSEYLPYRNSSFRMQPTKHLPAVTLPPPPNFRDIAASIKLAINMHTTKRRNDKNFKGSVLNISWGYPRRLLSSPSNTNSSSCVNELRDALKKAMEAGMHVTIGAGNDNKDACADIPAGYVKDLPSLIVVAGSDIWDKKAHKSNWGSCVDLHAPSVGITSTSALDGGKGRGEARVEVRSGSELAAPLAAGVIAGIMVKKPELRYDTVGMKRYLRETALKGVVKGAEKGGNMLLHTGMSGNPMESFIN
ncbi:serine protease [Orbilia ellipsospora]|uniref:Serine protease n=1 Tax=Orbilia ellipsospora TaxID=2528407 RepID=A0AAV9WWW8_9PEZI